MPSEAQIANDRSAAVAGLDAETAVPLASAQDRDWSSQHAINLRLTIPMPFGPFYLVILGGRERRSNTRRVRERVRHRLWTIGNFLVFLAIGTVAGFAALGLLQMFGRYALDAAGLASF